MARTIKDIEQEMTTELTTKYPTLSHSATAQWRLFTWVVATSIYTFEQILNLFKTEIEAVADKITPGTARWYVEQAKAFQDGHELLFDDKTAELYYDKEDIKARIISMVAITEGEKALAIKVAKLDAQGKVVRLSDNELYNFTGYVDSIKFAGITTSVISNDADKLKYTMKVYYDPAIPQTNVELGTKEALDRFRSSLNFNSVLYRQRFIDALMSVKGVVTVELVSLQLKGATTDYVECGTAQELESGYFDYETQSVIDFILASNL